MYQLAKRKADELEDFGGEHKREYTHPKEITDEGSKIVEEFLTTWASQCAAAKSDGEDVVMDNDDDVDREITILKETLEKYRDRIEGNPWIQSLIATL